MHLLAIDKSGHYGKQKQSWFYNWSQAWQLVSLFLKFIFNHYKKYKKWINKFIIFYHENVISNTFHRFFSLRLSEKKAMIEMDLWSFTPSKVKCFNKHIWIRSFVLIFQTEMYLLIHYTNCLHYSHVKCVIYSFANIKAILSKYTSLVYYLFRYHLLLGRSTCDI